MPAQAGIQRRGFGMTCNKETVHARRTGALLLSQFRSKVASFCSFFPRAGSS